MYDILPFPNITAEEKGELVFQINNYLIQLKETLEFALTNISSENLSQELIDKMNSLGADIQKMDETNTEQIQSVSSRMLTVSDVLNSPGFAAHTQASMEYAQGLVDALEYIVSGSQTTTSSASGGSNVFTFTDSQGKTSTFTVKNGEKGDPPKMTFTVDFTTGNLLYEQS